MTTCVTQAPSSGTLTVTPLAVLAREIDKWHRATQYANKDVLCAAYFAGEKLLEAKALKPAEGFLRWLAENCNVKKSRAYQYMEWAKFQSTGNLNLSSEKAWDEWQRISGNAPVKPKPSITSPFTREDAEYALKINARAERGIEGERDVAKAKLEKLAKDYGMTSEELVKKSKKLCPDQTLTAHEANNRALRAEILKPFEGMSKTELLDVIFDLIVQFSRPQKER
ncbi:MAG TPA: hypothetical protein VKY65_14620 [Alphaproteobacteria bacterium]|nr:hypothetical protein [Alphaproteobacteria bacterium]